MLAKRGSGGRADVARRAHRDVEEIVRAEGDELPSVMALGGQAVDDRDRGGGRLEMVLDRVVAQDAAHLRDVERALPEGDAVRHVEAAGDREDLVRGAVAVAVDHRVDGAVLRAHEDRALRPQRERARPGDRRREHLHLEPRRAR